MVSVRERIAIVFMTVSVVATLVLGGAVAYDLSRPQPRPPTTRVVAGSTGATVGADDATAGDQSAPGTDTGTATAAASGPATAASRASAQAAATKKTATVA